MNISTAAELVSFMVASYNGNLSADDPDALKEFEALSFFGIPLSEIEKVNGTGPWVLEYYGDNGDCLMPDWASLGYPDYENSDMFPSVEVTVLPDLLLVQGSHPGQVGREWLCFCLVKADVSDENGDAVVKFSATNIVVRFPQDLGEPVVTGGFYPTDRERILAAASALVERG